MFGRETVSDSIAAILGEEPDWSALGGDVPERIVALLRRCLAKDPRRRLHDIADARIDIEDALASPSAAPRAVHPAVAAAPAWRGLLPWTLFAAAAVALIVVSAVAWKRAGAPPPDQGDAVRFALAPPGPVSFTPASSFVSFSPDGHHLAFVANNAAGQPVVWVRSSDTLVARQLQGTEGARYTFWSPDSRHIGFFAAGGAIKKVGVAGDPPQMLSTGSLATPTGATWSPQGVILFSLLAGPIHRISASGGAPAIAVTSGDESKNLAHSFPCFLPDGKRFLYYKRSADADQDGIYLRDLDQGQERLLIRASSIVIHVPGHLLYMRAGALLAHPFDANSGTLSGDPIPIADGIDYFAESGNAAFSASQTGALVYRSSAAASMNRLVLVRPDWQAPRRARRARVVPQPATVTRSQEGRGGKGRWLRQSRHLDRGCGERPSGPLYVRTGA